MQQRAARVALVERRVDLIVQHVVPHRHLADDALGGADVLGVGGDGVADVVGGIAQRKHLVAHAGHVLRAQRQRLFIDGRCEPKHRNVLFRHGNGHVALDLRVLPDPDVHALRVLGDDVVIGQQIGDGRALPHAERGAKGDHRAALVLGRHAEHGVLGLVRPQRLRLRRDQARQQQRRGEQQRRKGPQFSHFLPSSPSICRRSRAVRWSRCPVCAWPWP